MNNKEEITKQTKQWLETIIIGLNFCPFAKKEYVNNTIDYYISANKSTELALTELLQRCHYLDKNQKIETSLFIFSQGFSTFDSYLDLVDYANELLHCEGFEGVFQLASFHPHYCFAGEDFSDAANYTNRSPLPMIHIIREESLEKVLSLYKKPEEIPENNVALAREKGNDFFVRTLATIQKTS